MRILMIVARIALLSACGEKVPEVACCAIEPKAKCGSTLIGMGVTPEEMAIVMSGDRICPSSIVSAERLRELDAGWPAACREAGTMSPAFAMTRGQCAATSRLGGMDNYSPPAGVDLQMAEACVAGLVSRGLSEKEVWLVAREPEGVCPTLGIDGPRIREIIAKDWDAAGCRQFTKEQMLHALDRGACRGDAGER